jgi:hypothetical protein
MNAKEAAAQVRKLEAADRANERAEIKATAIRVKSRVSNASRTAKKWFEESVTEDIKKAVEGKYHQTGITVYPHSDGGKAEMRALQKILRAKKFKVADEPVFVDRTGHDPDWGHYDHSYYYLLVSW